jgi:hypothetical protein
MTTGNKDIPKVFALTRGAGEPSQIVGYGKLIHQPQLVKGQTRVPGISRLV